MSGAVIDIRDRATLEAFFRRDVALHLYELGDLDPFFWPSTRWFGWARASAAPPAAIVLLYATPAGSTLLALERTDVEAAGALLEAVEPQLPDRLHAHLSPPLVETFRRKGWAVGSETPSKKMTLEVGAFEKRAATPTAASEAASPDDVIALSVGDVAEVRRFYAEAYPDNWFDPRMLETGQYFGARTATGLAAIAGVHVYSPEYGVAALGNIATHPAHRRRGWASRVTRHLCQSLIDAGVTTIGLNVHADNASAISCYEALGFVETCRYGEYGLSRSR